MGEPKFLVRGKRGFLEAELVGEGSSASLKPTLVKINPEQLLHFGSELHKSEAILSSYTNVYNKICDFYFLGALETARRADADYVFIGDATRRDDNGYSWLEGNLTLYLKKR